MKVAITGATGHIGGLVVRELHARDYTTKALVRTTDQKSLDGLPMEYVKGDLNDQDALKQLMEACDYLIHAAAVISIDGDMKGLVHQTNVEGTRAVMEAAKDAGIKRVIHLSSVHAYHQKPVREILDENRELVPDPTFAYDKSKREGQQIALSYASAEMEVLAVNPTSVLGPFDFKPSKLGQAIINMHSGRLPFVFAGGFDFCDARDIAHAIVNALQLGRSGEAYLLGGKWYTLTEFASTLADVSGKKNKPLALHPMLAWMGLPFIKVMAMATGREPLYTNEAIVAVTDGNRHISHAKAKAELNYAPRPLADSLRDTIEWFDKNGYLG
jgi:dihydroflavonol-4-reductase